MTEVANLELAALGGHSEAHHELLWLVALVVFSAIVFGLTLLYRRYERQVDLEEIDEFLRNEDALP